MAFHLKKRESPAKGVQRVCRERIDAALDRLREGTRPAAVHGVRKEIKKLRALFRLVRGEISRDDYRTGTKALHKAADCLAAARDARVMLRAFEKLAGSSAPRQFPEILQALQKNCRRETRRFRNDHSAALANRILKKTGRRARSLKIKADGWAMIEPGLKQSYRLGRETCRLLRREPSPEHFHEWRKHVKNLWYYLCLLSPAWPAAMRVQTDSLELLGELLGEEHDLVLLQQFVADACAAPIREVEALNKLVDGSKKKLRADALKLGSRLYVEAPAVICQRLKKYWDDWHQKARHK